MDAGRMLHRFGDENAPKTPGKARVSPRIHHVSNDFIHPRYHRTRRDVRTPARRAPMAPSPAARSRLGFGNSDEHSADCYFPASSTQPDRFIPNRRALDLDIAHYNLVKENANANDLDLAAEVASPSKVRRLLRQRPIRDDSRSSIESNKTFFTPRSRSFSPADLSSTEH